MTPGPSGTNQSFPFEGRVFGGYRIARPIATGGMATVYMARKTGPGRFAQTAAVKIIHPHLARDTELIQMFMDEARLASCVNHPNVCRVLDFGESEGTFFLAMEYVRGESWATVLEALSRHKDASARVSALAACVIAQACEGLHAIHEAVDDTGRKLNIVHRDVSPQNLLVAYDGSVRLLDFGIASAEGRAHTSSTDVIRGRFAYMAPEQMRGLDVDRRADIWSLGVMLREALTGTRLFARDTQIATMLAVTQEALPAWPKGVPLDLRDIADLALAHAPEERFPDARQLGDALNRYLIAKAEPTLNAELSQYMRKLFAEEITRKRAALRELAGDDGTDQFSSVFPAQPLTVPPISNTPKPAEIIVEPRPPTPRKLPVALLVGGLFAASLVGSLLLAPSQNQGVGTAHGASAGAHLSAQPPVDSRVQPLPLSLDASVAPLSTESLSAADAAVIALRTASDGGVQGRAHRHRDAGEASRTDGERSAKGAPGTVVIGTVQGWAEVFNKGQKLGTTPLRIELPSGLQVLELRPYGAGSSHRVSVQVKAGEVTKVRADI